MQCRNLRVSRQLQQIDAQGNIDKSLQDTKGKQAVEQIGAQGEC